MTFGQLAHGKELLQAFFATMLRQDFTESGIVELFKAGDWIVLPPTTKEFTLYTGSTLVGCRSRCCLLVLLGAAAFPAPCRSCSRCMPAGGALSRCT
jgi:hypothetical protein